MPDFIAPAGWPKLARNRAPVRETKAARPQPGVPCMAKKIQDWLETDVRPYREKPISWVSQFHFFRDPIRPTYSDLSYFFSPADGIILYQRKVHPHECIVEKSILQELRISSDSLDYLHHNQRVLNRIYSVHLGHPYYLLQIADYDVDCIVPFKLKQNQPVVQSQRFSQVRYGSQVDLIVPLSSRFEFEPVQNDGDHVEAGIDPVIRVTDRS